MSTNVDKIQEYGVVKKINLESIVPGIGEMEPTKESFWEVMSALERESNFIPSDYAVITKEGCSFDIGYCYAYFLNRDRR